MKRLLYDLALLERQKQKAARRQRISDAISAIGVGLIAVGVVLMILGIK